MRSGVEAGLDPRTRLRSACSVRETVALAGGTRHNLMAGCFRGVNVARGPLALRADLDNLRSGLRSLALTGLGMVAHMALRTTPTAAVIERPIRSALSAASEAAIVI